jgi:hypothetical protein
MGLLLSYFTHVNAENDVQAVLIVYRYVIK